MVTKFGKFGKISSCLCQLLLIHHLKENKKGNCDQQPLP